MEETWVTLRESENYEVNQKGVIRNKITGLILKQRIDPHGYAGCKISVRNKTVNIKVHRAVAQAFIPNSDNKPQVNHIDSDRTNNNVSNLEWVTAKENAQHAILNNRYDNYKKQIKEKKKQYENIIDENKLEKFEKRKPMGAIKYRQVYQIDQKGNIIKKWDSISDACRGLNITTNDRNAISLACREKYRKVAGYFWRYAD